MKVFEKVLKKKYAGKKLDYFKPMTTAGGFVPPNHFGGVIVRGNPVGHDTIIVDRGQDFLKIVVPHGASLEDNLETKTEKVEKLHAL